MFFGLIDTRWTWADLVRTWNDQSVRPGGILEPQDDFAEDSGPVVTLVDQTEDRLPFDRLAKKVEVVDFRQKPRTGRGRARGTRQLADVHTIWMHQTAALLGSPERFLGVPAHRGVPLDATAVLLHPILAYLYHGHSANRWTIGYEIACRAAGIEGDPRTVWISGKEKRAGKTAAGLMKEATDEQIETTRALIEYDLDEVGRKGGEIRNIGSHRQSHSSRISDPGSRLWKACGEWAIAKHGLKRAREYGTGRPNPTIWTGIGRDPYSWRIKGF